MIPGGRLGDLRGHRRIVVAGLAVFGGASLVCGLSSSYRPADRISGWYY